MLFFHILGIIIPTDYFFQRGWNHQPDNILNINTVIVFYIPNIYYMMVIAYCITIPDFFLPRTLLLSIYNISIELLVNCTNCFGCPKGVSRIGLLDHYAILDSKTADLFPSTIPMSSNKYCWCFTNLVTWWWIWWLYNVNPGLINP